MFPRKKIKKPPESFRYPHKFQIGDLVVRKKTHSYCPGELGTIIEFFVENGYECVKVFFQDTQKLQVLTLARFIGLYEKPKE